MQGTFKHFDKQTFFVDCKKKLLKIANMQLGNM